MTCLALRTALPTLAKSMTPLLQRCMASAASAKKEGDISSVFVSLSGQKPKPLPARFAELKRNILRGREEQFTSSWNELLRNLKSENEIVAHEGPNIIPQIDFKDIRRNDSEFVCALKKRGVAVIRGIIPESEARQFKNDIEEYVQQNSSTKAFPPHDPQVFEVYWSRPQVRARAHPNLVDTQKYLMSMWYSRTDHHVATSTPLAYADRVRIRQPGDASFALGPHIDGGSVERWEPKGYGVGNVYQSIFAGSWQNYDPWEFCGRAVAVTDLYNGAGASSMFRMFQGWLSMSHTGPGEGTLLVNPLLRLSTAYLLTRPFFTPRNTSRNVNFLDGSNWVLNEDPTSELHGAVPGYAQELNDTMHPHLELGKTMVHVPEIKPGDYVVWHCDTIHAVDKVHTGKSDSSVLYIPVCPITESNIEYLSRQRDMFRKGYPGPDFPGGIGESGHVGRATEAYVKEYLAESALTGMGLAKLYSSGAASASETSVIKKANQDLGY